MSRIRNEPQPFLDSLPSEEERERSEKTEVSGFDVEERVSPSIGETDIHRVRWVEFLNRRIDLV